MKNSHLTMMAIAMVVIALVQFFVPRTSASEN